MFWVIYGWDALGLEPFVRESLEIHWAPYASPRDCLVRQLMKLSHEVMLAKPEGVGVDYAMAGFSECSPCEDGRSSNASLSGRL